MPPWSRVRLTCLLPKSYQKLALPLLLSCFLWLLLMETLYHGKDDNSHRAKTHLQGQQQDIRQVGSTQNDQLVQSALRKLAGVLNSTGPVLSIKISVFQEEATAPKDVIVQSTDHVGSPTRTTSSINREKPPSIPIVGSRKPFEPEANLTAFSQVLNSSEKEILLMLATKLTQVTSDLNVTCFMYGGSLLGSYRHHDLIPWDDDIDVIARFTAKDRLYSTLRRLRPKYGVFWAGPRLKFYSVDSITTSKYPWKWPYVDIHFFKENATHIWDSAKEFSRYVYEKSYTFPLHPRPLGGIFLNAPKDSFATLKATYKNTTDSCETHYYSHKFETNRNLKRYRIPCEMLKDRLAFVHRGPATGTGIRETLMKGTSFVHSLFVDEPRYAISKPYSLELL